MNKQAKQAQVMRVIGVLAFILLTVGAIILLAAGIAFRDWLIIGYGIRTQRAILMIGTVLAACGAPMLVAFGCYHVHVAIMGHHQEQERRAEQDRQAQVLQDHMEGRVDPEIMRRQFKILARGSTEYKRISDLALDQMDRIDSLQARQELLIKSNDARYLADTEAALDELEQRIWRNLRHVYNLCIAVDDTKLLDAAKVRRYMEDNEARLVSAQELLLASANWINQYESDKSSDRSKVESWLETIRESLKEEG